MFPPIILVSTSEELTYAEGKNIEDAVDVTISADDLQDILNRAYTRGSRLWDEILDAHRELRDERQAEVAA
jgi:hypothetical protein